MAAYFIRVNPKDELPTFINLERVFAIQLMKQDKYYWIFRSDDEPNEDAGVISQKFESFEEALAWLRGNALKSRSVILL